MADLDQLNDEQLIAVARAEPGRSDACLAVLFERCYPKVARWCLRVCGDREQAADIAQDVMLRVHQRLDSFRVDSRFSTWLYTVTRRVAIDRSMAARRAQNVFVPEEQAPLAQDEGPVVPDQVSREQILVKLRDAMEQDLLPMEAKVVYLHYIDGLSLPAITKLMKFENRSGAKAYLVGGMRKLRRKFGPWLARQDTTEKAAS